MKVTKEFLEVVSQKGRTTGKDIKESVIKYMKDYQLDLKNLVGNAANGAPLMIRKIRVLYI